MSSKFPKLPKVSSFKIPKVPQVSSLKVPKLPKVSAPKLPSLKGITNMAGMGGINYGYIVAFLFLAPVIMGIYVFTKVGAFGAGIPIGIFNALGFIGALIGLIMTGISANMNEYSFNNVIALLITTAMTGYALYAVTNYTFSKKEEEKKK